MKIKLQVLIHGLLLYCMWKSAIFCCWISHVFFFGKLHMLGDSGSITEAHIFFIYLTW